MRAQHAAHDPVLALFWVERGARAEARLPRARGERPATRALGAFRFNRLDGTASPA